MNSHAGLELLSLIMDMTLIIISLVMASTAAKLRLGGAMGKTVGYVVSGSIVLGFAHLLETMLGKFEVSVDANEVIHRLVILVGFTLLYLGVKSLVKTFSRSSRG